MPVNPEDLRSPLFLSVAYVGEIMRMITDGAGEMAQVKFTAFEDEDHKLVQLLHQFTAITSVDKLSRRTATPPEHFRAAVGRGT